MPLPKRQQIPTKSKDKAPRPKSTEEKDARFADFQTNPLYRLPSKKHTKTKLDDRFSRLLTDPDFHNKASVDRYGRKKDKNEGKKELEKFYSLDDDDEDDGEEDLGIEPEKGRKRDNAVKKELARVDIRGNKLRDDISSSSDDSSSDEEEEEEDVLIEEEAELPAEGTEVPMGDVTSRLAAVNMDWDNIRAVDIMGVANSFVPAGGRILSVVIYPSEFGMERLQREEIEGPPKEIFASSSSKNQKDISSLEDLDDEKDEEQIKKELLEDGEGEDFNSKALRAYQLDRLRYYYAVITCSSLDVAKALYDNMDGREYLSSANFFDLRFVPDETTFDEDAHDTCKKLPHGYKPNDFQTDALTHSKVKLTWDADDNTRKEVQKRAFSRQEIDENELQAYLGSDDEEEDEDEDGEDEKTDKAAALRAALGLDASSRTTKKKTSDSKRDRDFKKPEGEMQITFSAGLSTNGNGAGGSVFENEPEEENTIEKYVRKQKERKQRRKEQMKALKEGRDITQQDDTVPSKPSARGGDDDDSAEEKLDDDNDDPWNDPFFADAPTSKSTTTTADTTKPNKKAQKAAKRAEKQKLEARQAAERANLELLMVDDDPNSKVQHFDMNEILKAEKAAKKKGSSKKNKYKKSKDREDGEGDGGEAGVGQQDDFRVDTEDPRFAKLFQSHEFAIDPTNPRFKGTEGMKALLEEGRKKRKRDVGGEDGGEVEAAEAPRKRKDHKEGVDGEGEDLKKLVARVRAKSRRF